MNTRRLESRYDAKVEPPKGRAIRVTAVTGGIDWSPSYVAFLVYVFVITTYRLPIGTAAMSTALILLPLEPRQLRFPPLMAWAAAFLAWAFVGWGVSDYPNLVWDNVVELAKLCGVMLVAVNVLTTRARFTFFILVFLGCFALFPVRGALLSFFVYGGTVEGRAAWNYVYNNPNDLAALCLLPLAVSAGVVRTTPNRWVRYCAVAGVIILPFVILLTQSRGAFIALVVFALPVLYVQKRRKGTLIVLLGVLGIVVLIAAPDSVWQRLGTLSDVTSVQAAAKANDEGSARQRMEIWRVGATIVKENPLTGVGLGAYPEAHYNYAQRPSFDPIALGHRDTHSTYLRLLAQTGVVGFVLFAMMLGTVVRDAERTRRNAKQILPRRAAELFYLEIGVLAYFVAGIWGSYEMMALTYLYLVIIYAATQATKAELPVTSSATSRGGGTGRTVFSRYRNAAGGRVTI